ncbi:MAG: ferritin-like domain-containing protein [Actinomycetota bacterium]|nr:ferritin-like domain-containing protein [Actinomycetota bacterium]
MRKFFPVEELARDSRFSQITMRERMADPRSVLNGEDAGKRNNNRLVPSRKDSGDAARALMHGIFVGEIQALEGAGRTCFDFETGIGDEQVPFQMKLDMARQCWDEARHVEISIKLSGHMGTELGEFAEQTMLFEAACNADPVLRLTGVNRALEGLAIDVFNAMKDFGDKSTDPVLYFCEDWMLADEVTHVKMGSDWLRKLTESDPDRRQRALDFQRTVDKLFSFGGFRGEKEENPVHLARKFRSLAGFTEAEIADLVDVAAEAQAEAEAMAAMAVAPA